MTCPICLSVDDTPLVAGLRAGALVLIIVATLIIAAGVRFAWRLKRLDGATAARRAPVK